MSGLKNLKSSFVVVDEKVVGGSWGRREGDIKECKLFNKTSVIGELNRWVDLYGCVVRERK